MSETSKRRLEVSITAAFVLALVLVAAVLIFSGGSATAKQIATLRILGGQVEVQHEGESLQPGEEGESLREGDLVQTGTDGRASIEYFDGSITRLDFDTSFELLALETLVNDAGSKVIEGSQSDGNSYNRVAELTDAASRFDIETPTATASVQGTVYAVLIDDDGSTTIATIEGLVTADSNNGSVDVPAGKMVVVGTGGAVGAVLDIPEDLLDSDWFAFNQCDLDQIRDCVPPDVVEPDEDEPNQPTTTPPTPPGLSEDDAPSIDDEIPPPSANNQVPHAGFLVSPDSGPAPLAVNFTDTSFDPDGDPLSRSWSFGDGASQNGGLSPTHTYDQPGDYKVTLLATDPDGASDTKTRVIHVGALAAFDHIVISPSSATIQLGDSQSYMAEAFDADGNSMGNVTGNTAFSIQPSGSCNGNTCTPSTTGTHAVIGTFSGDSDSASLVVEEPPPPPCPNYRLTYGQRPPATQQAGQPFNVQIEVQVLEGGDPDGPLTISLGGAPFSAGEVTETWTGGGTVVFNGLRIETLGTYGVTASAPCAILPDAVQVTITKPPGGGGGIVAVGLVILLPAFGGLIRRRR